jgi:Viral BACON domain
LLKRYQKVWFSPFYRNYDLILNLKLLQLKIFGFSFCLLILVLACKDPVPEPLPIPNPKLAVSKNQVDLGNLSSTSKSYIKLKKDGIGNIKYSVSSNKNWLLVDNQAGSLKFLADTIKFHVDLLAKDLAEGDNIATLTVKSSINDVNAPDYLIEIKGKFVPTILQTTTASIALGTIKKALNTQINFKKIGLEKMTYEAVSDKPWVKLNKTNGSIITSDSLVVSVDPTTLSAGPFEAKVTLTPKVLGVVGKPSVVTISGTYDDTITGTIEGHTLTKNETWAGNINLNGDINIPKGTTLTIKPGTIIKVKKLSSLAVINVSGKLIANGEPSKIIEIRSAESSPTDGDWGGIVSLYDIEISYMLIKNAKVGLNFENVSLSSFGTAMPNIHHVFFDYCIFAMVELKSNLESTLSNLSFRDIYFFSLKFVDIKKVNIQECEFLGDYCYIDVNVSSNNGTISFLNSNFAKKKFSHQTHLEVIDGYKNNTIAATNCFQLIPNQTVTVNGNKFSAINPSSFANLNIGCGFVNKYPQGRIRAK